MSLHNSIPPVCSKCFCTYPEYATTGCDAAGCSLREHATILAELGRCRSLLSRLWDEASSVHGIDTCSDDLRITIKWYLGEE